MFYTANQVLYIMSTSPWEQCTAEHEKGIVRPACDQFESWTPVGRTCKQISKFEGLSEISDQMWWIVLWFIVEGIT